MALPVPNVIAKPTAQKSSAAIARLTRILATTLPTFFMLENPTSSIAKPACMNSHNTAAMTTHTVPNARHRPHVLPAGGPGLEHREPGLHEQQQHRCYDHPHGVHCQRQVRRGWRVLR